MKIRALIVTAAVMAAAAVGATAYLALGQERGRSLPPAVSGGTRASAEADEAADPTQSCPTEWETSGAEASGIPTGETAARELPAAVPTGAVLTEAETVPAEEDPAWLLTLRGGLLTVTGRGSAEVVYSREVPEGRLRPADAARLAEGIVFSSPEAALDAVWELLT